MEQELQELRGREAGEELQMAEVKMAMHKEMLGKDEEITGLRGNLASVQGEREALNKEVIHQWLRTMHVLYTAHCTL